MISASLSYFDATVVAVIAISCLFAFFRGFVKEILSLGAWVGAGIITIYYFPDVAAKLEPKFQSPVVAAGIATLSLYIAALLFFSLINSIIFRYMKEGSDVGVLDNTLGLMFGALRGVLVVSLAFFMLTMVLPESEYPDWVKGAKTRPIVEKGAMLLARAAPDYLRESSSLYEKIEKKSTAKFDAKSPEGQREQRAQSEPQEDSMRAIIPTAIGSYPAR